MTSDCRYIIADVEMGGWICFAVGSVCLTFLQVFSYVGRHDVVLDGGDVGRDAFYPTYYLRHYLLCDYDYYVSLCPIKNLITTYSAKVLKTLHQHYAGTSCMYVMPLISTHMHDTRLTGVRFKQVWHEDTAVSAGQLLVFLLVGLSVHCV